MTGPHRHVAGALLCLGLVVSAIAALAAGMQTTAAAPVVVQYAASSEDFANPERGFYRQFNLFDLGPGWTTLNAAELRQYRAEGVSLIRAYYIIDEFRSAPFSSEALAAIHAHMAAIRDAGLKIIPRFTYSFPCMGALEPGDCTVASWGDTDAPVARVVAHIDQLAPVLQANADVIAFMEAGFVGAWGEWHDSTNALLATPFTVNASSAAIVARLLAALPSRRMVNIPLWHQKQGILGTPAPLTASQAFTGAPQARIGHQDDCLVANATNGNTYVNHVTGDRNPEPAKQYLSADNLYVPQSGESCSFAPEAQPFAQCANAVAELARIRWSALNAGYQPQVLDLWRQQGCFGEIARRLGYRLRLFGAELPSVAATGSLFAFRLGIANDGFAAPYNPRAVELVLRHAETRREHALPLNLDPRFWAGGSSQVLNVTAAIPADLAPGSYQLLLNLPDPEPSLRGRPDYSLRLANQDLWEASTGYNNLHASVVIERGSAGCTHAPAPPVGLAGLVSNGVASITWSGDVSAVSYVVHAGSAPGAVDVFQGSVGAVLTASAPVSEGFRAYVRVYAVNACGQSGPSNEVLLQ